MLVDVKINNEKTKMFTKNISKRIDCKNNVSDWFFLKKDSWRIGFVYGNYSKTIYMYEVGEIPTTEEWIVKMGKFAEYVRPS